MTGLATVRLQRSSGQHSIVTASMKSWKSPPVIGSRLPTPFFLAPGTSLLGGRSTSLDSASLPLAVSVRKMLADSKFMPKGGYLGVHLAHRYPHTHPKDHHFVPSMLKGVDLLLYESVAALRLAAVLSSVTKNNLPTYGVIERLDNWSKPHEETATPGHCSSIEPKLTPVDVRNLYDDDDREDDQNATEGVGYHYGYSVEAVEDSSSTGDSDYEPRLEGSGR